MSSMLVSFHIRLSVQMRKTFFEKIFNNLSLAHHAGKIHY